MKHEEFRQAIPITAVEPLLKGETKPCMRGVLDLDLYNRTGEIEMIEPFQEYVPPIMDIDVTAHDHMARRRMVALNPNKPKKEVLERHLRAGMSAAEIGGKYDASNATVYNWIRSYGLQGIKGVKTPVNNEMVQEAKPVEEDMIQESPTLEELEQFHTDTEVQELPKVDIDEPLLGMSEEENMTDEEWETQKFDHIAVAWQGLRTHLYTIESHYVERSRLEFRKRLREMLAEVVGES